MVAHGASRLDGSLPRPSYRPESCVDHTTGLGTCLDFSYLLNCFVHASTLAFALSFIHPIVLFLHILSFSIFTSSVPFFYLGLFPAVHEWRFVLRYITRPSLFSSSSEQC